jgi:ribosomal protein S18 acetylase RimI-like enzyme
VTWKIRAARESDGPALARIAEATFRGTFGPSNTAEDMDLHCSRYFTPAAQAAELADPRMDNLVVERVDEGGGGGRDFLGYAQLRSGPPPACVTGSAPIEIQRFYVVPELHGGGLARELMAAVIGAASERGADTIWLGVWEKNPRAMRFYAKCGFREVGDQTFRLGTDPQRDLVMSRPVILAGG